MIEKELNVSGDGAVGGSFTVRRNLRVEGWLDAPNLRHAAKGVFADFAALTAAYPHPLPGWWALVGASATPVLYVADNAQWLNTGAKAPLGAATVADTPGDTQAPAAEMAQLRGAVDAVTAVTAKLAERVEEAEATADEAHERSSVSGALPFNGILSPRASGRPSHGVWWVAASDGRVGHFLFVSSDAGGYSEDDYNLTYPSADPMGREDRVYRSENRLYIVFRGELVQIGFVPCEVASAGEFDDKLCNDEVVEGRLYCVVDPDTRLVTQIFMP